MELALTFGSVGDIIAVSLLIKDIIRSLGDCRGSSKEYQDLVHSLSILDETLHQVDQIVRNPRRTSADKVLCSIALKRLQQIRAFLHSFNSQLEKFRSSLAPGGSGDRLKDAARKIQFKLEGKDIEKTKEKITGYVLELKMVLETMILYVCRNRLGTLSLGH